MIFLLTKLDCVTGLSAQFKHNMLLLKQHIPIFSHSEFATMSSHGREPVKEETWIA